MQNVIITYQRAHPAKLSHPQEPISTMCIPAYFTLFYDQDLKFQIHVGFTNLHIIIINIYF